MLLELQRGRDAKVDRELGLQALEQGDRIQAAGGGLAP
jgi:hypothetical protein